MGLIKGEIVRNVFFSNSKNKSFNGNSHDQAQERKKWSKMRSYLCGDEFNSVLAEHDSDSIRSYSHHHLPLQNSIQDHEEQEEDEEEEAMIMDSISTDQSSNVTITQPISAEKQSSTADLFRQEDAAITIQSAFRNFRSRPRMEAEESIGTSLEVQTGNSIEIFTSQEKLTKKQHQKVRTSSSSSKLKEDWDDSTVSSNISKMRIQNRVEAMTRRERALAYAFSQQLRLCSKKKHINSTDTEAETSTDMAWSWLERWMATRLPDNNNNSTVESHNGNRDQSLMRKRLLDISIEEKESCGSNEVSLSLPFENIAKNRVKQPRTVLRKKVNKKLDVED